MCVLRVTGANLDAEEFLRSSVLQPYHVFKAGEPPRVALKPHEPVHPTSGFAVAVSDARSSDLAAQVSIACGFLELQADELRVLSQLNTVEDVRLDFSIEIRIGRDNVVA